MISFSWTVTTLDPGDEHASAIGRTVHLIQCCLRHGHKSSHKHLQLEVRAVVASLGGGGGSSLGRATLRDGRDG